MALISPWPDDADDLTAARLFVRAEAGFKLPATTADAVGVPTAEVEAAAEAAAAALVVAGRPY